MTTDTVPKQVALHHQRQLDRRRHGQGRGHARAVAGDHAVRDHHRRRRRRRRPGPGAAEGHRRAPSTASTSTAAAPPTTPCCCWPPAPARSRPARTISTTPCCGSATTCAHSCRPTPKVSPSASPSPSPARATEDDARRPPRAWSPATAWSRPRCSGPTRTGAACWPPSAWRRSTSTPTGSRVSFNGSPVCIDGAGAPGARDVDLSGADIAVPSTSASATAQATIRTTDLSHAYVEENSAYSS